MILVSYSFFYSFNSLFYNLKCIISDRYLGMLIVSADSLLWWIISLNVCKFLIVSPSPFSERDCEVLAAEVASRTVSRLLLPGVTGLSLAQDRSLPMDKYFQTHAPPKKEGKVLILTYTNHMIFLANPTLCFTLTSPDPVYLVFLFI